MLSEQYINNLKKMDLDSLDAHFAVACRKGNLELIEFLLFNNTLKKNVQINNMINTGLYCATDEGKLEVIQYLLTDPRLIAKTNVSYKEDDVFIKACYRGHLNIVDYLLTSPDINKHANIHAQEDNALEEACRSGHVHIMRYLLSSPKLKEKIDINGKSDHYLSFACGEENSINVLEAVKFLLLSNDIPQNADVHADRDILFRECCYLGHLDVIEYLLFDYNLKLSEEIRELAKRSYPEVAKLIEIKELKINLEDNLNIQSKDKKPKV